MKKIAVITAGLEKIFLGAKGGGGEILLKNLINELTLMPDIELSIFTPFEGELTNKIIRENKNIKFFPIYAEPWFYTYITEIEKIAAAENFDKIINYNMFIPYKTTMLQCHSYAHRCCNTLFLFRFIKKYFDRMKLKVQYENFGRISKEDSFIAVSETIKNDYSRNLNIPADKIKTIYPGVKQAEAYIQPEKKEEITFGAAVNSSINKGGYYLLAALWLVKLSGGRFKAELIAPKYNKDLLMKLLIKIFNLKNNVKILAYQNDMTDFYRNIDCLVLPSLNEAFGLMVLEAMSFSKPALVSSSAGSAEIIDNNKDGFIFNRKSFINFIVSLKKVIKLYNNDFVKFQEVSLNAYQKSKKFTWQRFAKEALE